MHECQADGCDHRGGKEPTRSECDYCEQGLRRYYVEPYRAEGQAIKGEPGGWYHDLNDADRWPSGVASRVQCWR